MSPTSFRINSRGTPHLLRVRRLIYFNANESSAFTIVELLVGAIVLVIASIFLLTIYSVSTGFLREAKSVNSKEALIDSDLSLLEDELAKITFCNGIQESLSSCNGQTPGGEGFYAPVVDNSNSSIMDDMRDACNPKGPPGIVSDVPGSPSLSISLLRSLPQPAGIVRTVSAYNPDPTSIFPAASPIHTVLIKYSYSKKSVESFARSYLLRPPVANHCP